MNAPVIILAGGVAERLRVLTLRNPMLQRSHCDIATAIAMMVDAGVGAGGPVEFEPLGGGPVEARMAAEHPLASQSPFGFDNIPAGLAPAAWPM